MILIASVLFITSTGKLAHGIAVEYGTCILRSMQWSLLEYAGDIKYEVRQAIIRLEEMF